MKIIIVGAGKLGTKITQALCAKSHDVTVVDIDEARLDRLAGELDAGGVSGSGTLISSLSQAGVRSADLLCAVTFSDEKNLLACLIAKRLGAKHTIARVRDPEYLSQIDFMRKKLGISVMINPDYDAAFEISRFLQFPSSTNIETFAGGRVDIADFTLSENNIFCDMSLIEISKKLKRKILVCAVERDSNVYIPNGNFVLKSGDTVYITGEHRELIAASEFFSDGESNSSVNNVMIIGGGGISVYLANILSGMGKKVIVADKNRERCETLCELCKGATVMNTDANDHAALLEDGLAGMDAVVSLTDIDETNIILSMFAKKNGIPVRVAKINNESLSKMIGELKDGFIVDVNEIASEKVISYVRSKKDLDAASMKNSYRIAAGKIEAAEFEVNEAFDYKNIPLCELKIKSGVLICVIMRENRIIFPKGNDCLCEGDTLIAVSNGNVLKSINDIIE